VVTFMPEINVMGAEFGNRFSDRIRRGRDAGFLADQSARKQETNGRNRSKLTLRPCDCKPEMLTDTLKAQDQLSAFRRNINMASTRFLTLAFGLMPVMRCVTVLSVRWRRFAISLFVMPLETSARISSS